MATERIFELRTYHAAPGKLDQLSARFRDHTAQLFAKHGVEVVGFWEPINDDGAPAGTFVYLLAFESREAAATAWSSFKVDPEWIKVRTDSELDGPLMISGESVMMMPTDYSPLA